MFDGIVGRVAAKAFYWLIKMQCKPWGKLQQLNYIDGINMLLWRYYGEWVVQLSAAWTANSSAVAHQSPLQANVDLSIHHCQQQTKQHPFVFKWASTDSFDLATWIITDGCPSYVKHIWTGLCRLFGCDRLDDKCECINKPGTPTNDQTSNTTMRYYTSGLQIYSWVYVACM